MTDLAKLVVRLEAQTGQYQAQLERAERKLAQLEGVGRKAIGALTGILAGVSFVALTKGAIDAADRMNDLSKQAGVTVETISSLEYAASQSGANLEQLTGGLNKLAKSAIAAADGTGTQAQAFEALGVKVKDANGNIKASDQLLLDVADSFSQYEDGVTKSAVAQALFGKSGAELIPFLNQGRSGIEALQKRANELGITLSTQTAQAADDFNDSIDTLGRQVRGLVAGAIGPLLPQLTEVFTAFADTAGGARDLGGATAFLQTGLKLLTDVGLSVVHTFRSVGRDLGALAAAAVQFATGNFAEAAAVLRERRADDLAEQAAFQNALTKLWSDGLDDTLTEVTVRARKIGKQLKFGEGGTKDAIGEVTTTAGKVYVSAYEKLLDGMDEATKTSTERQVSQFNMMQLQLQELVDAGRITSEQAAARQLEFLDEVLPEFEVKAQKIGHKIATKAVEVSEFVKRAQQLTVDTIADGLFGAIKGGLDDIPRQFGDMLLKLALQAQAAKIGEMLFGATGTGGSGFLGKVGSVLSSVVGGTGKASGGRVMPGSAYPINENTPNTEWFAPAVPGTVIPAGRGGMTVVQNFTIPNPSGTVSRQTQAQTAAAGARGIAAASRKNN